MTGYGPRAREEVERWVPQTIGFNEASPRESHNCAIVVLESGKVAGWIGFGPSSRGGPGDMSFGYAVLPNFRNRGYGTEALTAAIRFCFDSLGAQRFSGETVVGNDGSAHVMEKVGMRRIGVSNGQVQFLMERAV
jgi:RimJ/RimL family protein N-acetyltransferase